MDRYLGDFTYFGLPSAEPKYKKEELISPILDGVKGVDHIEKYV